MAVTGRETFQVAYSSDAYFEQDSVAIRSTSRWDIGLLHDDALLGLTGIT